MNPPFANSTLRLAFGVGLALLAAALAGMGLAFNLTGIVLPGFGPDMPNMKANSSVAILSACAGWFALQAKAGPLRVLGYALVGLTATIAVATLFEYAAKVDLGFDTLIAELQRDVTRLGLEGRVVFTGSRRDVPAVLAAADLAVSASTDPEAFGRAAIEAQAMGTPIIATDHGGSRETVLPGQTGWLVPPGDVAALATGLDEALAHPDRLAAMGQRGREHVLANFTTAQMLEKEFSAYQRLMSEPQR